MKTATVEIAAVFVTCPYCSDGIREPMTGSLMFEEDDLAGLPEQVKCHNCGSIFRRPAWPRQKRKAQAGR